MAEPHAPRDVDEALRRLGMTQALGVVAAVALAAFVAVGVLRSGPADTARTPAPTAATSGRKDCGYGISVDRNRPCPKFPTATQSAAQGTPVGGSEAESDDEAPPARHATTAGGAAGPGAVSGGGSVGRLVGRKIMTGYHGIRPSSALLGRVRRGEVGGVILMGENVGAGTAQAIASLQAAARAGGNPPLLIATDQEGGAVKRFASAPPMQSPAQLGAAGAAAARSSGAATGRALAEMGVNLDLAPVADVLVPGGFIGTRSFGTSAKAVTAGACAFAQGLRSSGVNATLKHFPGLGRAVRNTDEAVVSVNAPAAAMAADLQPYRRCASTAGVVMLSNASYPGLGRGSAPAVLNRGIATDLLRRDLGFRGVTISDTLAAPGVTSATTAIRASAAGVDMLLYIDEAMSARAYENVLHAVERGQLSRRLVSEQARRITQLVS